MLMPVRRIAANAALCFLLVPHGAGAQVVTTLAGSGAHGSADGTGTAATFYTPQGLAVDSSGNVYVADKFSNKIRKITPEGEVTTFAGSGSLGSDDGPAAAATFFYPYGVAVDLSRNVYVADTYNYKIRAITPAGVVSTLAGTGESGDDNGPGAAATFSWAVGVAADSSGNVYVADSGSNTIRKITPAGVVSTLAGSGAGGSADGPGDEATFSEPSGVAVDSSGNVFVADTDSNKIRKITAGGAVTTLAGSGASGSADGTGAAATFTNPFGVAVDSSQNVYVADSGNNKIRKITPAGVVSTLAGSGAYGGADGIGAAATFYTPTGVAVDSSGTVYVADSGNNKIRKITQPPGPCVQDAFTACLINGRYKVTSHWQNQYDDGKVSQLSAAPLTDATAAFWLSDADTYEYLIRINTATDNGKAWISIPTFTDVEFWIAVTDTSTGQYFEYHSDAGNRTLIYDPYFFVYP
ncbi:MAG TPA: NHL repeat-containing protein [Thermoanaerobaculia bacterium]|nr:NHL repeat-containing protein [Thermoanaerobaculia bacterium]